MPDSNPPKPPHDVPDWSRLPRDPVGFFGLSDGFDRKDLKRSYNRLLRQFKPEKHPDEFQRIRAAFEALERRLRYGHTAEASLPSDAWETAHESTPTIESGRQPTAEVARAGEVAKADSLDLEELAKRLEAGDETVGALYERLKKQANKTPPDFYALALIADAVKPSDDLPFLRWLLKGFIAWPGDPALSRLIYAYLASQIPVERLPQVLMACSKAVPGDAFFELTEGGWNRLLRGSEFPHFVETLTKCEEHLASSFDPSIAGRVAFTIHALRFALWKDQTDWKEKAWEFLEENYDQAPPHLEQDFDTLGIIQEYLVHRAEFVAGDPLRQRMDQVLETAFTQDQLVADRAMTAIQTELLEFPKEIALAFQPEPSEASSAFYVLWSWISEDTASRYAAPDDAEPDYRLWRGRIIDLLHRLRYRPSWLRRQWDFAGFVRNAIDKSGFFIVPLVLFLLAFFLFTMVGEQVSSVPLDDLMLRSLPFAIVAAFSGLLGWWRWWRKWIENRLWIPYCNRMALRSYDRLWRPETFDFLKRSLLDYFNFRGIVAEQAQQCHDERTWMSHFINQDYGLAIYSLAQRFRI